jgi:hypothetical protein
MQNPIDSQPSTTKSILVGIAVMIIGAVALYFLKFFGLTMKATLQKSISQASNSELYSNILLMLAICLLGLIAFIVSFLLWRKKEIKTNTDDQPDDKIETNNKENLEDQFKRTIFLHILKLRGLNQIASPKSIATQMNQDVNIVFAHLNKFHNEQYVTFQTGGLPPTVDTDFFLSPKAFEVIDTNDNPSTNKFIHFNDLLWLHGDPVPFCLHCYEADKKTFHMFVKIESNPPRYKCQHCGYYPKASKHPDDPEDPPSPKPKQPLFMTRSGWVTKWKDQ